MAYSARTLQQTSVINVTPNGNEGAIWMAGSGLAAGCCGNIYFLVGNGTFDTTLDGQRFPGERRLRQCVYEGVELPVARFTSPTTSTCSTRCRSRIADVDLGSGGVMILPDVSDNGGQVHHLAVGAGKDSNIYVVNRDNMGKWNSSNNNNLYRIPPACCRAAIWSKPAYFNNTVYYGGVSDH